MERFWTQFETQNGAKILNKSIQNSIEVLVGFLIGSWTVFDRFWERFGDLGPSKMSVSPKRGAIFEKITFFRPDSVLDGFLMDFGWFWEPFGDHFGIKIASKNRWKNRSDFGWILEGFRLPNGVKVGPILAPKIDQKSKSIFERFLENRGGRVGARGVASEGPFFRAKIDIFRHRV